MAGTVFIALLRGGSTASPSASPTPAYGTLTYTYDADGHVIDKGGSLAAVNTPAAVSTTSYSATDQVTNWNGNGTTPDHASNLTYDPASGASITWNARNQAASVGGFSEHYDGLGRRETNSAGLSFQHDGSAMIGWSETGASYSFLTLPGGGTLAGSYTANATTATWVPLIDASGSTLGLVNAANVAGGAVTTYTYDPSGTPTRNGATNLWPFLYKGLEQETIDAPYYYTGSGQFYSPQMVRSLSGAGETGTSGARGFSPAGMTLPLPSVSSAGLSPQSLGNDTQQAFQVGTDIYNTSNQLGLSLDNGEFPLALPLAIIGGAVDFLVNFFEDILGGGSTPEIPRQLRHNRHPLYPVMLGISEGLIVDEVSDGRPQLCGDAQLCGTKPLQKPEYRNAPPPTQPPTGLGPFFSCGGVFTAFNPELPVGCVLTGVACVGGAVPACGAAAVVCGVYFGGIGICYGAAYPNSRFGPAARLPLPPSE